MASDEKNIEAFNRAANNPELWRLRGNDLHTAAEVLRQKALEGMSRPDWSNLSANDPGIADCLKEPACSSRLPCFRASPLSAC